MPELSSSNLTFAEYEEDTSTVLIGFSRGHLYEYYEVPRRVFDELISAPSHGQYFLANLYYGYDRNLLGQWRRTGKGITYDEVSGERRRNVPITGRLAAVGKVAAVAAGIAAAGVTAISKASEKK